MYRKGEKREREESRVKRESSRKEELQDKAVYSGGMQRQTGRRVGRQ